MNSPFNYVTFILIIWVISISCKTDDPFHNYETKAFVFQGHAAKIVFPKKANQAKHWVWRARFWGHEPQTDLALLAKGFHIVYIDVAGLFGNEEAVKRWDRFYEYLLEEYQLNPKVVLEGMSRGGLIVYNWAAENTDKIFCIYADAPVCDIKSWPGGMFSGAGSEEEWKKCMNAHGLDASTILSYKGIPIYTCENVAVAQIPILHVCGGADKVVPFEENTQILEKRIRDLGGHIQVILKEGIGHHPHSLKDPKPIVDYIVSHTLNENN